MSRGSALLQDARIRFEHHYGVRSNARQIGAVALRRRGSLRFLHHVNATQSGFAARCDSEKSG
eukprot:3347306-Lingulodinium_polyedra.AAC.1